MLVKNSFFFFVFLTDKNDRSSQPSEQSGCGIAVMAEKEDTLLYNARVNQERYNIQCNQL